ncbi:MAG: hypothetical protein ACRD6N_11145 [Pyrinomonadaceae bacterium]
MITRRDLLVALIAIAVTMYVVDSLSASHAEVPVEALVNGELKRAGPGSVIFNASNQMHGIKNIGEGPATYHVINWKSPAKR